MKKEFFKQGLLMKGIDIKNAKQFKIFDNKKAFVYNV